MKVTGNRELLPEELSWADGGHASDVALAALADGEQAIVAPAVRLHVERCAPCTTQLGHAALLSLHTGARLATVAQETRQSQQAAVRRPLPKVAIALGLGVAALGLLPSSLDDAGTARSFVTDELPLFVRALGTLLQRLERADLAVSYASAGLLLVTGIALVRVLPRAQSTKEEAPR